MRAANPSAQGLTVSVAGTDISAPVSGNQFSLSGVPSGPLSLRFTGNGMDSELGLAPVEGTEDIDITVSTDGSTVALESERRSFGKEVQLEGLVESLPPDHGRRSTRRRGAVGHHHARHQILLPR